MSENLSYTEADLAKAHQHISHPPKALRIETGAMGLPSGMASSLAVDIRQMTKRITSTQFGGGVIIATVNSDGHANVRALYDDLIDTIARKCAHRMAKVRASALSK